MGIFGFYSILFPRNTLYVEGMRDNFDEECQPFPDGNSSKTLVSDQCEPNYATDDLEAALEPKVITESPSHSNTTNEIRSKPIQAQSRDGLGKATKAFIILAGFAVPNTILYSLRGVYICRKYPKEYIKIFNLDGYSVAPTMDSVEHSIKYILAVYRCII